MGQIDGFTKNLVFEQIKKIVMIVTGIAYTYLIATALGPSDFGIVTYFIGFIMALLNFAGLTAIQSLLSAFMPKWQSKKLFLNSIKYQYALIIPVIILVYIFAEQISEIIGKGPFDLLQLVITIGLLMPLYLSFLYLFRSLKKFETNLKIESLMQISVLLFSIIFVIFLDYGVQGVIYAQIIGLILCIILSAYYLKQIKFKSEKIDTDEIKKYIKIRYPNSILCRGYAQFIIVMLGLFVTPVGLGYYYLADKIYGLFVGKTEVTLQDVIQPYVIEKYQSKAVMGRFVSLAIKATIIMNLILVTIMIIVTKPLLTIVMPEFVQAADLIPLLGLIAILRTGNHMANIFLALNKIDVLFKTNIFSIAITIITGLIIIPLYGIWGILIIMCINHASYNIILYYYTLKNEIHIEFIPTITDLKYFYGLIITKLKGIKIKNIIK